MPRGGPRPGAGAPRNNLNALKNGEFSRQLRNALNEGTPQEWQEFLSRLKDDRFRARTNMSAALLWIRFGSYRAMKSLVKAEFKKN
jgi:hypothetical protein